MEHKLKLIYNDRIENGPSIYDYIFLTWSQFRPDGRELVNRKNLLWSITGQLVQFVEKTDCKSENQPLLSYSQDIFIFETLLARTVNKKPMKHCCQSK